MTETTAEKQIGNYKSLATIIWVHIITLSIMEYTQEYLSTVLRGLDHS